MTASVCANNSSNFDFLIIGNGRVSRHFAHYFNLLSLNFKCWARRINQPNTAFLSQAPQDLENWAKNADTILLLISDNEIERFIQSHPFLLAKKMVHFSGSLDTVFAASAHPLCTFGSDLYELKTYEHICFIIEEGRNSFDQLLPGLPNPSYRLAREKRALYHALCVFAGNFSTLLWQKTFTLFEKELNLPKEVLFSLLKQGAYNLQTSPITALTGPLVREDHNTVSANLKALFGHPERDLYLAFLKYYSNKHAAPNLQDAIGENR